MTTTSSGPLDQVELAITGMTCASCANRIERKLNKLEGVSATVNYATEKARVSYPAGMAAEELVAAVERAGYAARLPEPEPAATAHPARAWSRPTGSTCCGSGCCSSPRSPCR